MNTEASPLIVVEGPKGAKVHTLGCKRANMSLPGHSFSPADVDVPSATCCKPSPARRAAALQEFETPDPIDEIADAVIAGDVTFEDAAVAILSGGSPSAVAGAIAKAVPKVAEAAVAAEQEQPAAIEVTDADSKLARNKAAREEDAALKIWIKEGGGCARPATPNLEAVQAEYAGTTPKAKVGTAKKSSRPARTERHQRLCDTRRTAKIAKGTRRKMTDDELAAYVAEVRTNHPDSPEAIEREYAYWVEQIALSVARFTKAWEAFEAPATVDA
jgi:hypothetical protein